MKLLSRTDRIVVLACLAIHCDAISGEPFSDQTISSTFVSDASSFIEAEQKQGSLAARNYNVATKCFSQPRGSTAEAIPVRDGERKYVENWAERIFVEGLRPLSGHTNGIEWNSRRLSAITTAEGNVEDVSHTSCTYTPTVDQIRRIEIHRVTNEDSIVALVDAPKLFAGSSFSPADVKYKLSKVLNIPKSELQAIDLIMDSGDLKDGTRFTYGHVFDKRLKPKDYENPPRLEKRPPGLPPGVYHKHVDLIPEDKREWYSPMTFWIADGKLCLTVSTIDWKSGDRPM